MSTSTDGGLTWSTPIRTDGNDKGLGGQPVVQPSGRVIVPFESLNGTISAFHSDNGGASWSRGFKVSGIRFHRVAGGLRTSPLPSAEISADGTVYVAWEDCRFRKGCTSNDIVVSTSTDGVSWTDPARVPIDDVTSSVDHFIPGLAVDPTTSGASTHLALTYYFYPNANCGGACRLQVGYISSPDSVVLDYACGEALFAARVADACAQLYLAEPAPGVRGRLDGAQRDRADLAGADGGRLHLNLVLGREGDDGVRHRA